MEILKTLIVCAVITYAQCQQSNGGSQLEAIHLDAGSPIYGTCYEAALGQINADCYPLTEDSQARLAWILTNCFMIKLGQGGYECDLEGPITECLAHLAKDSLSTYATFYAHAFDICVHLTQRMLDADARSAMKNLSVKANIMTQKLSEASATQSRLLLRQHKALEEQHRLTMQNENLHQQLHQTREITNKLHKDMEHFGGDHYKITFAILERIASLQSLISNESTWYSEMLYYGPYLVVIYVAASLSKTLKPMVPVFALMILSVIVEKLIFPAIWGSTPLDLPHSTIQAILQARTEQVWALRNIVLLISCLVWIYKTYTVLDPNDRRERLLNEIRHLQQQTILRLEATQGRPRRLQIGYETDEETEERFSDMSRDSDPSYEGNSRPDTDTQTEEEGLDIQENVIKPKKTYKIGSHFLRPRGEQKKAKEERSSTDFFAEVSRTLAFRKSKRAALMRHLEGRLGRCNRHHLTRCSRCFPVPMETSC